MIEQPSLNRQYVQIKEDFVPPHNSTLVRLRATMLAVLTLLPLLATAANAATLAR
jgi:hypothetical protein